MYGCIESLSSGVPVRQPWDGKLLQPNELCSEVVKGRAVLHADMLCRWKTEISEPLERFYFIATICDPRQKELQFPGVSDQARTTAHDWFLAEYESLWRKEPVERTPGPAPTSASAPTLAPVPAQVSTATAPSLGSFQDFMTIGLAHLNPRVGATATVTEPTGKSEGVLHSLFSICHGLNQYIDIYCQYPILGLAKILAIPILHFAKYRIAQYGLGLY